jgi:competence protein ComFC
MQESHFFSRIIAFGIYESVLAEAVHQFKFRGLKRFARPLGDFIAGLDLPSADGIVPVPMTVKGLRQRGFNQSLLLACRISKRKGIPVLPNALLKQRETVSQLGLSAVERKKNLKNAFVVKDKVQGRELLLIDDVVTTGATVEECSKALMRAGAGSVTVVAVARAGSG